MSGFAAGGKPTRFEKLLFKDAPPPPPHLKQVGAELVAKATPKFKGFRIDLEAVESAAWKAGKAGVIELADAEMLLLDHGGVLSLPLVRRYIEACEMELVARWLMSLGRFHFPNWATERNLVALDGMVAVGEQALAVRVVRKHLEKTQARAKACWRRVGAKRPAQIPDHLLAGYEEQMEKARWELPGQIDAARMEIAELEQYVRAHGSHEDNRAIDKMLDELKKASERFNIG